LDLSYRERSELASRLTAVGPLASTLCEGWRARELVAHLVIRERHAAAAGIAVPQLRSWSEAVLERTAAEPFSDLVRRFREGPPRFSLFRLPGVHERTNTIEFVVHHEDVRRAESDWVARPLAASDQRVLWKQLVQRRRLFVRHPPVSVTVTAPHNGAFRVGDQPQSVELCGEPLELLLYLHGRRNHAVVQVLGDDEAIATWVAHVASH
jgi:uncharacterized protein (TIGR03085 family)